jgi:hypothetical protein
MMVTKTISEEYIRIYSFQFRDEALELIARLEKEGWINVMVNWRDNILEMQYHHNQGAGTCGSSEGDQEEDKISQNLILAKPQPSAPHNTTPQVSPTPICVCGHSKLEHYEDFYYCRRFGCECPGYREASR